MLIRLVSQITLKSLVAIVSVFMPAEGFLICWKTTVKATPDTLSHRAGIRSVQSHTRDQASHLLPTSIREIGEMCEPHFPHFLAALAHSHA